MRKLIFIYLVTLLGLHGCNPGNAGDTPVVPIPSPPILGAYPIDIDFGGLPDGPITGNEVIDGVKLDGDQAIVSNGSIVLSPGQLFLQPPDPVGQVSVMIMDDDNSIIRGFNESGDVVCEEPLLPLMTGDYRFYSCTSSSGNNIDRVEVVSQDGSVLRVIFSKPFDFIAFEKIMTIQMIGAITDLIVDDLNGDGLIDVAVVSPINGVIDIAYGDLNGDMTLTELVNTLGGSYRVIASDLGTDGLPELVTSRRDNGSIEVFDNLDGFFGPGNEYPVAGSPGAIAAGDISGDDVADLAVAGTSGVSILINDGNGAFGPYQRVLGISQEVSDLALADMDLDGKTDLVVLLPGSNSIEVWLGDNAGGFVLHQSIPGVNSPQTLAIETLDWDRYPEVAVASAANPNFNSWLNLADGTLSTLQSFQAVAGDPVDMILADINADGFADMVMADGNSGDLSVFVSQLTTGQFQIATTFSNGPVPIAIGAGDFNGDNKTDILTAGYWGAVRVFLNVSY